MGGGAIASSSLLYLILPIIMGLLLALHQTQLDLGDHHLPASGSVRHLGWQIHPLQSAQKSAGLEPQKVWNMIIMVYCIIAAVVPVWALLQPRGHLGGYFLYASVIVAAIGVLFGGFTVKYPAFTKPYR